MKKLFVLLGLLAGCVTASAQYFNPAIFFTTYQGPCDVVTCAEAYSVTRAMRLGYTGPLFQLNNGSSTLDIGQTAGHVVDLSTWSAFCSGVASNCTYSKFYAQINTTANDLTPFNAANKTPFTIEAATGLPQINDTNNFTYTVGGSADNNSTGITASGSAESVVIVGHPTQTTGDCCGSFGTAHKWNDPACPPCTTGTDFMLGMNFGTGLLGGLGVGGCLTRKAFCVITDLEQVGDIGDYSLAPVDYVGVITFNPAASGTMTGYVNGVQVFNNSPPGICGVACPTGTSFTMNSGKHIHFAGGGDLSGPAPIIAREMYITNSNLSVSQVAAITVNAQGFYSTLSFPSGVTRPATYAAGPGDVVSSAKYFVGLRAYSTAEAAAGTQNMVHVQNISTTHTCDLLVATNGGLGNTANCSTGGDNGLSALAFCGIYTGVSGNGFNGGPNCVVDRFYDQTGNGFSFLASGPDRGKLLLSCLSFSPCYYTDTSSGNPLFTQSVWVSVPQPYSTSMVAQRDGATSTAQAVLSHDAGNNGTDGFFEFFAASANLFTLQTEVGNPSFTASASDNSFHAIQALFNAASSSLFIDGVSTSGVLGSDAAGSTAPVTIRLNADVSGTLPCNNCQYLEVGFWPLGFTGTQKTNINANQHNYWGF